MSDDRDRSAARSADGASDEPDLLPEAEQRRVAALLADVPPEPMPTDVADRLHAVLASESRDRASAGPPRTVPPTSLASRRRRRVAPLLAAAAVTVAVVAVGVPVVTGQLDGGQDTGAGGGSAADTSRSDAQDESAPDSLAQPPAPGAQAPSARSAAPRVDDLASLPAGLRPAPTAASDGLVCRSESLDVAADRTREVVLRGTPAWVVLSVDDSGRRLVAYRCAGVPDGAPAARIASAPLR